MNQNTIIVGDIDVVRDGPDSEKRASVYRIRRFAIDATTETEVGLQRYADDNSYDLISLRTYPFPVVFKSHQCLVVEFIKGLVTGDTVKMGGRICKVVDDCAFDIIDGKMHNLADIADGHLEMKIVRRKIEPDEVIAYLSARL